MSVYHGKVLELIAIEKNNDILYLHIKFFFEQEVEFFWEIDSDTAENLMVITKFDENQKYRLSLHSTFDAIKKQYISILTKTYRDKSDRICFSCSEDYNYNLDSIKNTRSINDLNKLPFISINLSTIDEKLKKDQNDAVIPNGSKFPFKWVSVPLISLMLVMLFGYSNNSFLNKAASNNTDISNTKVEASEVNLKNKKTFVAPGTKLVTKKSMQSSLPYIKLDDSLTYSLPEGYVSLTFDDGPSKYTMKIVDILKKYKVGSTFFFIGVNVKKHPDYVQYVQSNGYSIGSHSMDHVQMSTLSYEEQKDELLQSIKAIEDITNEKVVLFRPPYEAINNQTKDVIRDYHEKMILWNRDTEDWKTRNSSKIFNYVRNTNTSGSIILLHESQAVIDALPKIIERLQQQNLKIVSLQ
jgi:peptidoglycan-N-acetylglucosamine deacetylase